MQFHVWIVRSDSLSTKNVLLTQSFKVSVSRRNSDNPYIERWTQDLWEAAPKQLGSLDKGLQVRYVWHPAVFHYCLTDSTSADIAVSTYSRIRVSIYLG